MAFNSADTAAFKNVWVFCEQRQGVMMPTTFELISEGRKLANELGVELCGILLGDNVDGIAAELGEYGADKVYVYNSPLLKDFTTDAYTKVIVEAVEELMDDLNDYVESIDDDLAELEGSGGDDFHSINDDEYEDEYYDELEGGEYHLHLLGGKADRDADDPETLAGSICPACSRMFFVSLDDPEDAQYDCPHCGKRVTPTPLTPENAPIARPVED